MPSSNLHGSNLKRLPSCPSSLVPSPVIDPAAGPLRSIDSNRGPRDGDRERLLLSEINFRLIGERERLLLFEIEFRLMEEERERLRFICSLTAVM